MDAGICLLCCKSLTEGEVVVVGRGLPTLIHASQERKDEKHKIMANANELTVHALCRKNYTRPSSIKAFTKPEVGEPAHKVPRLRPREVRFDYKKNCLFCGQVMESVNVKLPKNRRRQIREVETNEIKDSILQICAVRKDELGEIIGTRVTPWTDLVSEEARYHLDCYSEFQKYKAFDKSGRPVNKSLENLFCLLFDYLEENTECQYTATELRDIIKQLPGGEDEEISDYLLKTRLKQKYDGGVIFTEMNGKPTIFSFLGTAHQILSEQWYQNREKSEVSERLRIVQTAAAIIKEDIRAKIYETKNYPTFGDMERGGTDLIPNSLQLFMKCVTSGEKNYGRRKSSTSYH